MMAIVMGQMREIEMELTREIMMEIVMG